MENNIVIIGAGPAGLMAAYEILSKTQYKPIIIEKCKLVGGLAKCALYNDNILDIGGHRFFTNNKYILDTWNKILPFDKAIIDDSNIVNNHSIDKSKFLLRNKVSSIYYLNNFIEFPLKLKHTSIKTLGINRIFKIGTSYLASKVFKKKEDNLENYYINRFGKYLYNSFFKDYTSKVCGVDPKNISSLWGKNRIKGLNLSNSFKPDNKKIGGLTLTSFYYPPYGPSQFFEALEKWCTDQGAIFLKNKEVNEIKIVNNKVESIVVNHTETYNVSYLFSSISLKDLVNIVSKDAISLEAYNIANNLPYRNYISVNLLLKDLLIHNHSKKNSINNRIKDTWIYIPQKEYKVGRVQILNNWSPYLAKDNKNTTLIGLDYFTSDTDSFYKLSPNEIIDIAIDEATRLGFIKKEDIIGSAINYSNKAYPSYYGSFNNLDKLISELNKIDNLSLIGRNGTHTYLNMDEAMLTSVNAVAYFIKKQS